MKRLLRGATLHTADDPAVIAKGDLLIEGEHILALGQGGSIPAGDAEVIDLAGRHLCPGFIDAHVHVGVFPEGFPHEAKDLNEMTRPVTPEMRAIDAVWPGDVAFFKARAAGVTTVCVLPGSANVIGGTGVVLRTVGIDVEEMARRDPACLKVAFGYNVKHSHGLKSGRSPLTRMGIAALFREAFDAALLYEQKRAVDEHAPRHAGHEALLLALRREIPVRAHCSRSDDILTALRLAREYGLRLVLEHGYEATFVLEKLRANDVAVVFGPAFRNCGNTEELHFDFAATKQLDDAGLCVAHMTDHPIVPVGYLPLQAGLAVRAGMSPARALRTITANPARILGVEDRLGRLAPGFEADLVVLDGPPLEIQSRVLSTWIGGRAVYADGEPTPVPGSAPTA
ncbi:MAG: amidohydrolase [Myxococcales bacterium]|nr:amidohydrolase [Myxococcales bacterium]